MTSFFRQKYKKKIQNNRNIHHKNIFHCSKFEVNQINTRRVILPQKKLAQYSSIISQRGARSEMGEGSGGRRMPHPRCYFYNFYRKFYFATVKPSAI